MSVQSARIVFFILFSIFGDPASAQTTTIEQDISTRSFEDMTFERLDRIDRSQSSLFFSAEGNAVTAANGYTYGYGYSALRTPYISLFKDMRLALDISGNYSGLNKVTTIYYGSGTAEVEDPISAFRSDMVMLSARSPFIDIDAGLILERENYLTGSNPNIVAQMLSYPLFASLPGDRRHPFLRVGWEKTVNAFADFSGIDSILKYAYGNLSISGLMKRIQFPASVRRIVSRLPEVGMRLAYNNPVSGMGILQPSISMKAGFSIPFFEELGVNYDIGGSLKVFGEYSLDAKKSGQGFLSRIGGECALNIATYYGKGSLVLCTPYDSAGFPDSLIPGNPFYGYTLEAGANLNLSNILYFLGSFRITCNDPDMVAANRQLMDRQIMQIVLSFGIGMPSMRRK